MTTTCGNCGRTFEDYEVEDGICDICFEKVLDKLHERAVEDHATIPVLLTNVHMEQT